MQAQSGISEAQQAAVAAAGQESQQDQLAALARSLGLQSQVTLLFHNGSVSLMAEGGPARLQGHPSYIMSTSLRIRIGSSGVSSSA